MEQQNDLQKRLLLALALSFAVFVAFDILMPKRVTNLEQNQTTTQVTQSSTTPKIVKSDSVPQAPKLAQTSETPTSKVSSLATVKSDKFIYNIDEFGRIAQLTMLEKKYEYNGEPLKVLDSKSVKPLEVRFSDSKLNEEAHKVPYTTSNRELDLSSGAKKILLTQKLSSTTVTKEITFYKDGHYDIDVKLSTPKEYFIMPGERPNADHTRYMVVKGVMIKAKDKPLEIIEDGDAEEALNIHNVEFTSSFDRYFTSILYNFEKPLTVYTQVTKDENALLFVEGEQNMSFHGYLGPKEYKVLEAINPKLTDAIEYGLITMIAKPMFKILAWIHDFIGNWGWAIIIFTILVKLLLFPLSYKGMMSMQKLKDLAPQMKELRERYAKDPQKMNMKMMELYKKHGANPMGGCLPMLLQIPIFFGIYRVLLNSVELQGAPWMLWIQDLSQQDPYFILPILMGASMWYQQKLTPNTMTDPMQQKIFQFLPVVMTLFFLTFPAGLVLYWLVNNLFTIGQQIVINNAYAKQKATKVVTKK